MKYYVLFLTIILTACANREAKVAPGNLSESIADANAQTEIVPASKIATPVEQKVQMIRTADYRFTVSNVRNTISSIETLLNKYPAYVTNSNLTTSTDYLENKMTIRVQADHFEKLLKEIDGLAVKIDRRDVSASDVGKEFVDLESRLKTKREVEARYMDILRKNTGTIEEILSAERQIGQMHEEIEATIARVNYLREQVSYSTIVLEFYAPVLTPETDPWYSQFTHAFTAGSYGAMQFLVALAYLWPLELAMVITWIFYKFRKRKINVIS